MSAELGLIAGLGIIAYILINIAQEVEDAEKQINQAVFTLSLLFLIGLEYTAYGIAQSQGFSNAVQAYLVALLITSISLLGLLAQFAIKIKSNADKDEMESL